MTQDATTPRKIPADRQPGEMRAIADRLKSIFRNHPADPTDPHHVCRCGWKGESFEDHLVETTLSEMHTGGYEFWPTRHV